MGFLLEYKAVLLPGDYNDCGIGGDIKSGAEWMLAPLAHPVQDTYTKKLGEFLNFTFMKFA